MLGKGNTASFLPDATFCSLQDNQDMQGTFTPTLDQAMDQSTEDTTRATLQELFPDMDSEEIDDLLKRERRARMLFSLIWIPELIHKYCFQNLCLLVAKIMGLPPPEEPLSVTWKIEQECLELLETNAPESRL